MLNISKMHITDVQFFDYSEVPHNKEAGIIEYSANVIFDDVLLVQLSGNQDEAHSVYIPSSTEQYYNSEKHQDWAVENLDAADVQSRLDELEIENNFDFLKEIYTGE